MEAILLRAFEELRFRDVAILEMTDPGMRLRVAPYRDGRLAVELCKERWRLPVFRPDGAMETVRVGQGRFLVPPAAPARAAAAVMAWLDRQYPLLITSITTAQFARRRRDPHRLRALREDKGAK